MRRPGRALRRAIVVTWAAALVLSPTAVAAAWSSPATISAAAGTGYPGVSPDVAMDAAGDAVATWISSAATDGTCPCLVRVATRTAGGAFGRPATVPSADAANSEVAIDAAGNAIVVWNTLGDFSIGTPTGQHIFAAVRPAGGSFGPAMEISAPARGGANPAISMDSGGDAVIAFTSGTGAASTDVEVSYRPAGGSFSPPAALTSPTDSAPNCCDHHNLAMSPSGKAIVAYDVCTAASLCSSSTPTAGTRRIDAAIAPVHGPFAAPFAISPTTSVTSAGVTYPVFLESSVAIDDSGDAAVGMAHELSASTAQTEVASSDGGRAFATPAVLDPSGSAPLVAIDASRETVAQWPTASNALASAVRPAAGAFAARTLVATLVAGAPLTALTAGSNLAPASGKVLSAWFGPQGTTGDAHVGAAFRAPGGNFGSPSAPSSTTFGAPSSFASPISAALDQAGNGVIVWLTAANTVQASFNGGTARPAVTKLLTVLRAGSGSGRVQSQDRLIDCGSFCVHAYAQGTVVNLQASAATRSKFTGWAGACTGTGRCSVTLSTVRRVTATFAKAATPAKPTVKIKRHPRSKLKAKRTARVSFGFVAKGITSGFKCKLDRGAFKKCKSPQRYSVRPGRHTFAVEAVGPGGTSKRASFKFTVVRTPPQRHK